RLAWAFSIVAILVLSLAGGILYHTLSLELRQRDDNEISLKLAEFSQQAHEYGASQAIVRNGDVFREALQAHPDIYFAIFDGHGGLLTDSEKQGRRLTSALRGDSAQWAPYTCDPSTIGPSRCVFADQKLPSGETVRI